MRRLRAVLAGTVVALLLAPAGVTAQDGEISFPPDSGWQGKVDFSGFVSLDIKRDDGSFDATVTDVIDDTHIAMAFLVGDDGQITSGTMEVELVWFTESAGTSPVTLDPYHITSAHFQTGTLAMSGNADRLVASGTLTHTSDVDSAGQGRIESVSGTEAREVEWTFHVTDIDCVWANGEILRSSGVSLMNNAWQPRESQKRGRTSRNALDVELVAWPAGVTEDPEALKEVSLVEDRIRSTDYPEAQDLLDLVEAWNDLSAELARYDQCQAEQLGWTAVSERSWFTSLVQEALDKALDNADYYKADELSWLWAVGLEQAALDEALMGRFLDVFGHKLDQAIAIDLADEIRAIRAFAERYDHTDLWTKANEALEGGSG